MHDNLTPVSTNGQASLKDRVRELRLDDRLFGNKKGTSSSGSGWLPWVLCFILALAWVGVGIRFYRTEAANKAAVSDIASAAPQNSNPETAGTPNGDGAAPTSGELVLEKKGYIVPAHQIPISPIDVAGCITELTLVEGDIRNQGDVLARIDPTSYEADLKEAQANVAATQARFEEVDVGWKHEILQAESDLEEAKAQMYENKLVYEANVSTKNKAVAQVEIDQSRKKYEASVQRVRSLEAKLELTKGPSHERKIRALEHDKIAAEARLARAQWRLNNCTLRAPVTGMILTKKAECGSLINPVVGGVSTSLCEMADLLDLEVDLEVDERDISKVRVGQRCTVRVDAYPQIKYAAYVARIMPAGNRSKAILPIRVAIEIPKGEAQGTHLKPEMNALVQFFNEESTEYRKKNPKSATDKIDPATPEKKGNS